MQSYPPEQTGRSRLYWGQSSTPPQNTDYPQWQGQSPFPPPPPQQWQGQSPLSPPPQQYMPPPPPPPQYEPPQSPKKKANRTWIWVILALFIGFLWGYAFHTLSDNTTFTTSTNQSVNQQAQAPTQPAVTPTPTHTPQWTTVQSFSGSGTKKTAIFSVPGDWKIIWSCDNTSQNFGVDGVIYISVYGSDGSLVDFNAVSGTCTANKVVRVSTEEHQAGDVYLDINTGLPWTIQVQDLK